MRQSPFGELYLGGGVACTNSCAASQLAVGFHYIGPAPRNPQLKLNLLVVRGCVATARRHSLLGLSRQALIIPPINCNSSSNSKLNNSQCALAHNSSLGFAACLSKNSKLTARLCRLPKQELLIRTASAARHANIVQRVKMCYKIIIDSRVLDCCFYGVMLCKQHPYLTIAPLLQCNSGAIRVRKWRYCMIKVALLYDKSGAIV